MSVQGVTRKCDLLVIGGGYYGVSLAEYFSTSHRLDVVLAERENSIMRRASYTNQARVHGGYHYPRALDTARGSRRHFLSFLAMHRNAIQWEYDSVYGIAKNSSISSKQFEQICKEIGAPFSSAPLFLERLFDPALVEDLYRVEEYVFDTTVVAQQMYHRLSKTSVRLHTRTEAKIVSLDNELPVATLNGQSWRAKAIINATYAGLDCCGVPIAYPFRKELAEIAIIRPAPELDGYGITVIDGPFFSSLPFPALSAFSLTHVRYTPVMAGRVVKSLKIKKAGQLSDAFNGRRMIDDASRFLPAMCKARLLGSIFEIKVVAEKRENDDGRPTTIVQSETNPRVLSILGSKIDTITDAIEAAETAFVSGGYFDG